MLANASLGALGPPFGDGCLDARHASGKLGRLFNIRVEHQPGTKDATGRINAYQVVARANTGIERRGPRMAFGEGSGIVRAGDETDTLANLRLEQGGLNDVRSVRACAEYTRESASPDPSYPATADKISPMQLQKETESELRWLGCWGADCPAFDPRSQRWNHGTYTPLGNPSRPDDYVREIRPHVYGVTGVRSIRTTARGPVYSTLENRAATEWDSIVPPCAYEFRESHCAPAPGGTKARASVVAPDSIEGWGVPFTLCVEDLRPATERQHPYQYSVICEPNLAALNRDPPNWSFENSAQCVLNRRGEGRGPAVRFVRVWDRDYAGAETSLDWRVRVLSRDA